jgi:hypothetical protein
MSLELHPNDAAREAKPSMWVFEGPWVGTLVVGVMFFISLFVVLSRLVVDWIPTTIISALPLGVMTLFVQFFVNGKAPSYALDLFALQVWRLRSVWYLHRLSDKPPQFWVVLRPPLHPRDFS